ncbi:tetraspanin-18-like [Mangifera indica]|uniref:tetraspanin-18-like n=1 Tax=Mangifera indica TaxID=29780 RepID=UPI001CF98368|nr:tetraspanin-18-like [Mangifera indica]
MAICTRCCLLTSLKIVDIFTNLFAVGMIVYALWLQKKWNESVAELPPTAYLPRPWFIQSCLAVGMAVCLTTLFGHMVANCINNSILCIYILIFSSLVFIEVFVVIAVFFRMDWESLIAEHTYEHYKVFSSFVVFHLKMCQLIVLLILVPQINIIALALLLWAIGIDPRSTRNNPEMRVVIQSFLVGPSSPLPDESRQTCNSCENALEEYTHQSFWSFFKAELRMRFQRTRVS